MAGDAPRPTPSEPIVLDFRAAAARGAGAPAPPSGRPVRAEAAPAPGAMPVALPAPPRARSRADAAPYGHRAAAWLIDGTVIAILSAILGLALSSALIPLVSSGDPGAMIALLVFATGLPFLLANVLVTLVYALPLLPRSGARNGQTLGKQVLGLRVVRVDGRPIDRRTAVLREVVWRSLVLTYGGALLLLVPLVLTYLWPVWDPRGQALHDKAAGTRVVRAG